MKTPRSLSILLLCACAARGQDTKPKPPDAGRDVAHGHAPTVELEREAKGRSGTATPLLQAMQAEAARASAALGTDGKAKPYYFGYRVHEADVAEIVASQGALELSTRDRERVLDVEMRVGDHQFDNHHWHHRTMPGMGLDAQVGTRSAKMWGHALPVDDDPGVLATGLWVATDHAYKSAAAELEHAKAQKQLAAKADDDAPDFSKETPVQSIEAIGTLDIDAKAWEPRIRELSAALGKQAGLISSEVRLVALADNRYFVSNDGSVVQSGRTHVRLIFSGTAKADDGMDLSHADIVDVAAVADLPDQAALLQRVDALAKQLQALRKAPVAEPFVGPAVLEGRAAAVYFHEVFGHRVEGHRQEDESEGQTFADKLGTAVMPGFIDVYDDPTIARIDGTFLNGHYRHDDEGVPASRAALVDHGKLVGFLMSRTPTKELRRSNGHGRAQAGSDVVARQGNLVVSPSEGQPRTQLTERLLDLVRTQKLPYGLRFVEISGGVTNTSRYMAQAFQVTPVVVFRVYPDGREELVRGVTLEGTPLSSLTKIVAAGDEFEVFNGFCGAESGFIPVSAASPALLLSQIEVARAPAAQDKPPLLDPPTAAPSTGGAR